MFADSHTHIHDDDFPFARNEVLGAASEAGVNIIVTMTGSIKEVPLAIDYVKAGQADFPKLNLYTFLGVHPHELGGFDLKDLERLKKSIIKNPEQVKGVGEIGLDYFYDYNFRDEQIKALEMQLQLATELDLPVSLHVRSGRGRDAFLDLIPILKNFSGKVRGVLHSFTDNMNNLRKVLDQGLYIGVNGIITFNRDEELANVYKAIPKDRLVLETDAPYLTPKPYRGQANQPKMIPLIAESVAKTLNLDPSEVAQVTTKNTKAVYDLS